MQLRFLGWCAGLGALLIVGILVWVENRPATAPEPQLWHVEELEPESTATAKEWTAWGPVVARPGDIRFVESGTGRRIQLIGISRVRILEVP